MTLEKLWILSVHCSWMITWMHHILQWILEHKCYRSFQKSHFQPRVGSLPRTAFSCSSRDRGLYASLHYCCESRGAPIPTCLFVSVILQTYVTAGYQWIMAANLLMHSKNASVLKVTSASVLPCTHPWHCRVQTFPELAKGSFPTLQQNHLC